jgi:hypothetical protein
MPATLKSEQRDALFSHVSVELALLGEELATITGVCQSVLDQARS